MSKEYVEFAQRNNINFQEDIIRLPTGDGAAIVFPFDGLPEIHLFFAKQLLRDIYEANSNSPCPKYNEHGWCNCHANFGIRVGISEGKGIIYKDINDNYNVAGGVINMSARIMTMGNRSQIMFTEEAYRQIIDMVDDPNLVDRFREYKNIRIKHNIRIPVYQYLGEGELYIDPEISEELALSAKMDTVMSSMSKLGEGAAQTSNFSAKEMLQTLGVLESLANTLTGQPPQPPIQLKDINKEEDS